MHRLRPSGELSFSRRPGLPPHSAAGYSMRAGRCHIPVNISSGVMEMENMSVLIMVAAAALLLYLFIRIIRLPLKWMVKAALHAAVGFVALFVLNFIGSWVDIELEMNLVNCLITGIFGVPGVIILLVIKYIL